MNLEHRLNACLRSQSCKNWSCDLIWELKTKTGCQPKYPVQCSAKKMPSLQIRKTLWVGKMIQLSTGEKWELDKEGTQRNDLGLLQRRGLHLGHTGQVHGRRSSAEAAGRSRAEARSSRYGPPRTGPHPHCLLFQPMYSEK